MFKINEEDPRWETIWEGEKKLEFGHIHYKTVKDKETGLEFDLYKIPAYRTHGDVRIHPITGEKVGKAEPVYGSSEYVFFYKCPHCNSECITRFAEREDNIRYCPDCGGKCIIEE